MNLQILSSAIRSRTVQYAIIIAVLSVLQGFVFAIPVAPQWQALIGCAIAVGIVVLRAVTTQPLAAR